MSKKRKASRVYVIAIWIIILLVVIALPSFLNARKKSQRNACLNNLRMIYAGMYSAAMAFSIPEGGLVPIVEVTRYLKGSTLPACPSEGKYTVPSVGENPTCSEHGDLFAEEGIVATAPDLTQPGGIAAKP